MIRISVGDISPYGQEILSPLGGRFTDDGNDRDRRPNKELPIVKILLFLLIHTPTFPCHNPKKARIR